MSNSKLQTPNSKLLLVAATYGEAESLCTSLNLKADGQDRWRSADGQILLLITGVGMISAAFCLGEILAVEKPDLAIHFGIAGAFDRSLKIGQVVEIEEDVLSEMGAESGDDFLDLEKINLPQFQLDRKKYFNLFINKNISKYNIEKCKSLTVNTVSGNQQQIDKIIQTHNPQIESMESGAFFHAMIRRGIPFHSFRCISNYVEVRDTSRWNIPLAVKSMNDFMLEILTTFHKNTK